MATRQLAYNLPLCAAFSTSCTLCTTQPGCGYCTVTRTCMPVTAAGSTGAVRSAPTFGTCPAAYWTTAASQCRDPCRVLGSPYVCLNTAGCGWCQSSCTCLGAAPDHASPLEGRCEQWVQNTTGLASSDAQLAACGRFSILAAIASVRLQPPWPLRGSMLSYHANLSALSSTFCITCAQIDCGQHGTCFEDGTVAACRCRDGWLGNLCEVPPGPCHGVDCSGRGVCVELPRDDQSVAATCICSPPYNGPNCEYSDGILVPPSTAPPDAVSFSKDPAAHACSHAHMPACTCRAQTPSFHVCLSLEYSLEARKHSQHGLDSTAAMKKKYICGHDFSALP